MSRFYIRIMPPLYTTALSLLCTAPVLCAQDIQWNNGAGNNQWSDAANWAGGVMPGPANNVHINLNGANKAVFSSGYSTYNLIRVGDSSSGELDVNGGLLASSSTTPTYIGTTGGQTGILTQTGGYVQFGGYMEVGCGSSATGTINLSGGVLDSDRNGTISGVPDVSIGFGSGAGAQGSFYLSGGELATRTGILLGGSGGTGRFEMDGWGIANIGTLNTNDDGFWVQNANSVLAAYVTNGALGSIYVAHLAGAPGTYSSGNVIFMPGSVLQLGFHGVTNAGSWNLMTWDGALLTNGLSLAAGTDPNWSFQFITNGSADGPNTLRVTYISAALSPPSGIVAVPGNGQVTLRWSALSNATNYFLLRGTSSGGPYTVTNSLNGTSYTDTGLANGVTCYYVVNAATTNGMTGNSFEVRATPFNSIFIHPGVMSSISDLNRMLTNVIATNQPWYTGYTTMLGDFHSPSSYAMEGPLPNITRDAVTNILPTAFQDDCGAAYQNALLWYLTGDPAHAAKAIQILDAWSSICTNMNGSDARLAAGLQGFKFTAAAELIRYTGAPWSQAEINTCSNFIRTVILPQNVMYGGGNWGQCGAGSAMAAGVFMEDQTVFNNAMNSILYGAPTECDMGIVNYIFPAGYTCESERDIGHWGLALDDMCQAYWTAWCQGIDMWTFLNNRLLTAHEYLAYFNANNTASQGLNNLTNLLAPYIPPTQCDGPQDFGLISQTADAIDDLGTWYYLWEQAYNPYQNMIGVPAPWSYYAVTQDRPEGFDRDHIAFGTLVCALPPLVSGVPVMPSGLTAMWSNSVVNLSWNSASNAAGYVVVRSTSRGGAYSNITGVLTTTNYADNTVSNGVLYFYKVFATNAVGQTVNSGLAIAYPSATAPTAPTGVTASTTSHVRIDLAWDPVPGATDYTVARSTSSAGPFTTIATGVGTIFLTYADTGLTPGTTYYYVVSAGNNIGQGLNSSQASATTLPALPSPWNYSDAGYLTTPGHATYSNGAFTVCGAGLDMGALYTADAFGLAYVSLTGNGAIIARLASRTTYSALTKEGLVLRDDLSNGSRNVAVQIDGSGVVAMVYRKTANTSGSSASAITNTVALPQWLEITRTNNVFKTYISSNGLNWTNIGSVTMTLSNTVYAGFAVCSRNNGWLDSAVFDNASVTAIWPALPGTPADLIAVPGDSGAFLNWSAATNASGYNLKRGNSGAGPFATIAANLSNLFFTDTNLANGALYYYAVSGTNFFGESANSSPVGVRPVSQSPPAMGFALADRQIQFNWPTDHIGWELQAQTNSLAVGLGTNWATIPGSDATDQWAVPLNSDNGSVFFRLILPLNFQ